MRKGSLFELSTSPDGYGPSDHASFYKNDIPVLFFTTGAHDDYHTPFDDAEKLDYVSQADILSYSSRVIKSLANYPDSIPFTESGSTEENSGPAFKVTLGIIPDVASSDISGLRVDGVRSGGPAQKGGILKGDIIVAMDGKTVTNVYDYMARLADLKAGQTTVVEVIRNGKKEVLLIQL
jgi:C-terminal processing protease CtpA/Prc